MGNFTPQDEPDVRGYLYHCMFQVKDNFVRDRDILPTLEWAPSVHKVDMAVIRNGVIHSNTYYGKPLLLIEIKETGWDIDEIPTSRPAFRIWLMSRKRVENDVRKLREKLPELGHPKAVVGFFFRSSSRDGMKTEWMKWCSELATEVASRDNVVLIYGPKAKT